MASLQSGIMGRDYRPDYAGCGMFLGKREEAGLMGYGVPFPGMPGRNLLGYFQL